MASHYIGLNRGNVGLGEAQFTVGTSTGSTDIEVRIDDTIPWSREEVVIALQAIADKLSQADPQLTAWAFPVAT